MSESIKNGLPEPPEQTANKEEAKSPSHRNNRKFTVLVVLLVVGVVSGSFVGHYIGYSNGYQSGFKDGDKVGIEEGYATGYELGYVAGNDYGYSKGYSEGSSVGYQRGFTEGNRAGYLLGFKAGNLTGYLNGYNECWQSGFQADGYIIRDPTYQEALNFIAADQTNNIQYDVNSFNCNDFSATVKRNAFNTGYRAFYVYIDFKTSSHSVVAFNTTDKGIIFVEPQYDQVVKIEAGENYSSENGFVYNPDQIIIRYGLVP